MLKTISLAFLAAIAACVLTGTSAFAWDNDWDLNNGLCNSTASCGAEKTISTFHQLARNYAVALSPMHLMPAYTLGEAGFAIDVQSRMSFSTDKKHESWKDLNGGGAPDMLATVGLHMRKGLPFSLEVEADFSYLIETQNFFYIGAGLRWAITEGWSFLPDLSVRGHVGTVVGGSLLQLININVDATLSYTWGLGGVCSITPYGGYSLLASYAGSRTFITTGGAKTADNATGQEEYHFAQKWLFQSRGFVGLELKADYFVLDVAGDFGEDMMSVGAKIGTQF